MSDLKTAAQQALEALEKWSTGRDMDGVELNDLIATLEAALAQQEQEQEQEKEPVVVYRLGETDIYDFAGWLTTRPGVMRVGTSCEAGPMAEAVGEYLRAFPERFTAHPPRREWQGLTEEEIGDVFQAARNAKLGSANDNSRHRLSVVEIARAVEQALKERNNG